MWNPYEQIHNYFNFLSVGILNISFQSAATSKYATPTGLPLRTFSSNLENFSRSEIKDGGISFCSVLANSALSGVGTVVTLGTTLFSL